MPNNLNNLINSLYNNIRLYTHKEVKDHNLTPIQWQILNHLDQNNGNLTQNQLSKIMQRDLGQLTRLLNQLESLSLIRKAKDKKDKRMRHILLTKVAKNKIVQIRECISKHYTKQKQDLSDQDYEKLLLLLSKIKTNPELSINN
jgi:MarR family transcriptional regulator, transcriptional regulator for hemolysin